MALWPVNIPTAFGPDLVNGKANALVQLPRLKYPTITFLNEPERFDKTW